MKRFYKVQEGFDMSGMSDTDYTDTFADMDFTAEQRMEFIAGLREAASIQVDAKDLTEQYDCADSDLDSLFFSAVSETSVDGVWTVDMSCIFNTPPDIWDEFNFSPNRFGERTVHIELDLDLLPAAWKSSFRWRLVTDGSYKYRLNLLAGEQSPSLAGSPVYVDGDVMAGDAYCRISCKTLIDAPEIVTGDFGCIIDPEADGTYKPGFLNGAPLMVGNEFNVSPSDEWTVSDDDRWNKLPPVPIKIKSCLWDKNGKITPAFTDNKRRTAYKMGIDIPHSVYEQPEQVHEQPKRYDNKSWGFSVCGKTNEDGVSHTVPPELLNAMLPGMYGRNFNRNFFSCFVFIYGSTGSTVKQEWIEKQIKTEQWLMRANGLS